MIINCPACGKKILHSFDVCPHCGLILKEGNSDEISNYAPSSATDTSGEFTKIADVFEDDISGKKRKDDLLDKGIENHSLNSFINWGYVDCEEDTSSCSLTDLGKKAFFANREWKKKKKSSGEDRDDNND